MNSKDQIHNIASFQSNSIDVRSDSNDGSHLTKSQKFTNDDKQMLQDGADGFNRKITLETYRDTGAALAVDSRSQSAASKQNNKQDFLFESKQTNRNTHGPQNDD